MKKNLFKSLLTMCALGAMFTACSNEGNEVPDVTKGEKKTVFMKLDLRPQSRATEDALGTVTAQVNDLHIYFYENGTGNIQKYLKVNGTTTPSITDLSTGAQITDVPAVADKVLVRGNVPAGVSMPIGGAISGVENKQIEITTQNNKDQIILGHLATDIQTWGGVGVAPITGMQSGDKYANVQLEPGVARIELEGLEAQGVVINAFKLDGIYVTNFFEKLRLGDGTSSSKIQYGTDVSKYAESAAGTIYNTPNTHLYDQFAAPMAGSGNPLAVIPNGGGTKRWAYHAFPNDATTANDQLQLVFKLSNVTADPSSGVTFPVGTPQFLTVRGFKDSGTGNIVKLEKGKIYTISKADFKFDESNLTTVPNTNAVGVWLKVTVKPWTVVAVKPNL